MNRTALQSTLREFTALLRLPRLWATFAIVVAIFVATGPSGTINSMGLVERAAFWTLVHAAAWSVAILIIGFTEILLQQYIRNSLQMLALTAVIAAPLVAGVVELIRWSWLGRLPTIQSYARQFAVCLPLSILFSFLSHMTLSKPAAEPDSENGSDLANPVSEETREAPPLLARLKPETRGAILHLTVEDHYTVVTTTRGRQLLLLRFSDALREVAPTDGLQIHRSHWVAADHVAGLARSEGRLVLRLKSGAELPVSRSYSDDVRRRFGEN